MRIWQKMVEGQRVRGVNENARHIVVEGPKDRGTFPQCNLGVLRGGAWRGQVDNPSCELETPSPTFLGTESSQANQSALSPCLTMRPQKDLAALGTGCRSRIEELIRARHHIRTPAI